MPHTTRHTQRRRLTGIISYALTIALLGTSVLPVVNFNQAVYAALRAPRYYEKTAGPPPEAVKTRALERYGKLPMSFEANAGQTDGRVKFVARGAGYSLFLTDSTAVLSLRQSGGAATGAARETRLAAVPEGRADDSRAPFVSSKSRAEVVRMKLSGANRAPQVIGENEQAGKSNYFIGNDATKWRTNVSHYGRVRYREVYRGIDQIYYGTQGALEYDFIVAPNADYQQIKLQFEGAKQIKLDELSGELILTTKDGGEVRQHQPVVYQEAAGERRLIDGGYVKTGKREIGFQIGAYDQRLPLIIDPTLVYSTYLGGSGDDFGSGIAVDTQGNAYITGGTRSTNFPTKNPLQATFGGGFDAFVTKLNATGDALVYSTYLGGSVNDSGNGIAVDTQGNAYITGGTRSTNFPTKNPLQATFGGGESDAFVTKLNATGDALVYSTYLGGSGGDQGRGIAVDTQGNAYITGETTSTNFPTKNPLQATFGGGESDAFVTKLNATGDALVYSTYLGGSGGDQGRGIAVDAQGNTYITGGTRSTNFPTKNPLQATFGGGEADAFVTKLNATGDALVYSTYLGGSDLDFGNGIAVDTQGNAYITGGTRSTNFPTKNPLQATFGGGEFDAFVTKLNATGDALVYSTYLGGSDLDSGNGIAVDAQGNTYITGGTRSTNFPTKNPLQATFGGGEGDAFVTKLNATGDALVYSTYLGGSDLDFGNGIAVDTQGNAYITGETTSTNFPTKKPLQATFGGGFDDAFVTKISDASVAPSSTFQFSQSSYTTPNACAGTIITVTRSGDTSQSASVDYQTTDGTATQKSDFTIALGTLSFAPGETSQSFTLLTSKDGYAKGTESATLTLSNPVNATLGSQATAQLQITDTQTQDSPTNPIDDPQTYVCQHYHDFLNREADPSGLQFWINQLTSCNGDANCIDVKRQNVSAAYFLSREFQETGFFVIRVQRAAFGKFSNDATKRISYLQFLRDAQTVGKGFVDLQAGADQILEQNKTSYAQSIASSQAFISKYPTTLSAAQFVDAVYQSAGVLPQGTERQDAINAFGTGDTAGRAASLRKVAESNSVKQAEFAPAFVLLQYFGYLRRSPTDLPDTSDAGYQFWLNKLNQFGGDPIKSEVVRSFILSSEYRKRFGTQ